MYQKIDIQEWQKYNLGPLFLDSPPDKFSITNIFGELLLTVVEWKDYHFLVVATVSDLQNSHWNQWPHSYEPQICNRFVFSAVCLHFAAILTKFAEKTSAKKTMCLWMKSPC